MDSEAKIRKALVGKTVTEVVFKPAPDADGVGTLTIIAGNKTVTVMAEHCQRGSRLDIEAD